MNIIAIGGGSLKKKETFPIDRAIVQAGKKETSPGIVHPYGKRRFPGVLRDIRHIYGNLLGCITDHLLLYKRAEDRASAVRKIKAADLIYVGGGNTLRMMKVWRRLGIDKMLIRAGQQGTVLAGLSAGAICWYEWGHSDSRAYSGTKNWSYIKVRALGICPGLYCPHLDSEKRHASLKAMVLREKMTGIACDNKAAIHSYDSGIRCIASTRKARVHIYSHSNGRVTVTSYRHGEEIDFPRADIKG